MNKLYWWFVHLAIFAIGQGLLFVVGQSWPAAFLAGEVPDSLTLFDSPAMWVSLMWCIVLAVDTVWSWSYVVFPKGKEASTRQSTRASWTAWDGS